MKLSELLSYRSLMDQYDPRDLKSTIANRVDPLLHTVNSSTIKFTEAEKTLHENYDRLLIVQQELADSVQNLRAQVQVAVDSVTPGYLSRSYQLYDQHMKLDTPDFILDRRISISEEARDYLAGRIRLFTDWRCAGMVINPGRELWIADLVALDPLYLVGTHRDLLDPAVNLFREEYQRRLRCYVIEEDFDREVLANLPDGQIGFCLVYNFFNYKPFEMVRKYLTEIHKKLRPGGRICMTINDCDRAGGVELCEKNYMCFTPAAMILGVAEAIGYQLSHVYHVDAACTWIEMSKPGTQSSLRGGQTLAKIISRDARVDKPN
jgi:SAM-dependent methyltransferase